MTLQRLSSVHGPAVIVIVCLAGCVQPEDKQPESASEPVSTSQAQVDHKLELNLGFVMERVPLHPEINTEERSEATANGEFEAAADVQDGPTLIDSTARVELDDSNSELKPSGPWLFNIGNEAMIRPLDSGAILTREARLFQAKAVNPEEVTVLIRSDKDVSTDLIQELIKLCQDAGFEKFAITSPSTR